MGAEPEAMERTMIAMLLCAGMANLQAQYWNDNGNNSMDPVTNFLGNTDDRPMNIRTEDIRRFRLNYDENYAIGSFPSEVKKGNLLLSPDVDAFYWNGGRGPFSLLHLADGTGDNSQPLGYRPWMRVGVSFTGNADQAYFGHKYTYQDPLDHTSGEVEDLTDAVLQWSDNPNKQLKDRLRFIFTSAYNEDDETGAGSLEGLEGMRPSPRPIQRPADLRA